MKKIILLLSVVVLSSCGGDKSKERGEVEEVIAKDKYAVILNALYEKDDELVFTYKKGGYWDYDHPVKFPVKGQPGMQQITVDVPEGGSFENVQIDLSTNKEQKVLTLTGLSISHNDKIVIDGKNMGFVPFFNTGTGLKWDEKNMRYDLIFGLEYPPRIVGNEKTEQILFK